MMTKLRALTTCPDTSRPAARSSSPLRVRLVKLRMVGLIVMTVSPMGRAAVVASSSALKSTKIFWTFWSNSGEPARAAPSRRSAGGAPVKRCISDLPAAVENSSTSPASTTAEAAPTTTNSLRCDFAVSPRRSSNDESGTTLGGSRSESRRKRSRSCPEGCMAPAERAACSSCSRPSAVKGSAQ